MVNAPDREERIPDPDVGRTPDGKRPRRPLRAIVIVVVLALCTLGVVVTWPEPDPPIASDKTLPPEPVDPDSVAAPCAAQDLSIGLEADRLVVTPDAPVHFTVVLRNEGRVQCLIDAPQHLLAATVYQGESVEMDEEGIPTAKQVWSSAECADPEEERLLLLGPGDVDTTKIAWPASRSLPDCKKNTSVITAGEYTARVTHGDLDEAASNVVRMTYKVPEPTISPSPSESPSGGASNNPSGEPQPSNTAGSTPNPNEQASSKDSGQKE